MFTFIALAAPFVLYAIAYWVQSIREKRDPETFGIVRENNQGTQKKAYVKPSGDIGPNLSLSNERNRRKRQRKRKRK